MIFQLADRKQTGSELTDHEEGSFFYGTGNIVFTALSIGLWIYRSVATPLVKLRKATQNIKEGNLDFVLGCGRGR